MTDDNVAKYEWLRPQADFVRREEMVAMRDGVKLYTVIVYRKGTRDAPIRLSRTPYDAAAATSRNRSQRIGEILPLLDAPFVDDGYIRVYQAAEPIPPYDRNPQSWVPSIFDAPAGAYRKATQTVRWGGGDASAVWLPVVQD